MRLAGLVLATLTSNGFCSVYADPRDLLSVGATWRERLVRLRNVKRWSTGSLSGLHTIWRQPESESRPMRSPAAANEIPFYVGFLFSARRSRAVSPRRPAGRWESRANFRGRSCFASNYRRAVAAWLYQARNANSKHPDTSKLSIIRAH